jgi:hypothetical protein
MVIESSNPDFDKTILKFQTFDIGTSIFNTILVKNLDRILFVLDGYGNVRMNYGGLTIGEGLNTLSSGMTINTGGLRVTGGITAESNTLVIQGRTVVSGVTIGNGGMSVVGTSRFRAEATVTGGFSIEKGLNSTYVSHVTGHYVQNSIFCPSSHEIDGFFSLCLLVGYQRARWWRYNHDRRADAVRRSERSGRRYHR